MLKKLIGCGAVAAFLCISSTAIAGPIDCKDDAECAKDEICDDVKGVCVPVDDGGCLSDDDCELDEACDTATGECVIVGDEGCLSDDECALDEVCNLDTGFCEVVDGAACEDDLDCLDDEFCDVDGFCSPLGDDGGCSVNGKGQASTGGLIFLALFGLVASVASARRRRR